MDLSILNREQLDAVKEDETSLLVLAGAGSGKTRVITHKIVYLIKEKGISPKEILGVTFTNKAAKEMKERITLMGKINTRGLIISTFHSFCVRVLRSHIHNLGYQSNFTIIDEADQTSLIKQICIDNKISDRDGRYLLSSISRIKENLMRPEDYAKHSEADPTTALIYKQYQTTLKGHNYLDFDDLILLVNVLFNISPEVQQHYAHRFKYLLVDEFQDTNPSQYALIKSLGNHHKRVTVVGDDDQSIYSWRGADISCIQSFEKDFKPVRVIKLEQNYRSTNTILQVSNAIIKLNQNRMSKNLWSNLGEGEVLKFYEFADEEAEADGIADLIHRFHFKDNIPYKHFAVLCRTNFQFRGMEDAFRNRGIPYKLIGGFSFYDRKEVKDIAAYLRVILNPKDDVSLLRIINFPKRGIGAASVEALRHYAVDNKISLYEAMEDANLITDINPKIAEIISEFHHQMEDIKEALNNIKSICEGVKYLVYEIGYKEELMRLYREDTTLKGKRTEVQRRIQTVDDFTQTILQYENNPEQYKDDLGFGKPSLAGFMEKISLLDFDDDKEDKEINENKVQILTIHSAKGLEFPFVFISGFEEGLFPHENTENKEEERRLCYVAFTRAMQSLTLTSSATRKKWGEVQNRIPSSFLEEIPRQYLSLEKQIPKMTEDEEKDGIDNFFAKLKSITQ